MHQCNITKNFSADLQRLSLLGPGGREVTLCRQGAAIKEVFWPCADSTVKNIALPSMEPGDYAGTTLGPVAGRIPGAELLIEGERLPLCANEGNNTLHGGAHNLSRQLWDMINGGADAGGAWLEFACTLGHGLDGFPGNRHFKTRYQLTTDALTVSYTATTDRATPISLSNHTYWNLTGDFSTDCYEHLLELRADGVFYNDGAHLPFGLRSCEGSAFDFLAPISLKQAMARASHRPGRPLLDSDKGQLKNALGYNNGFALTSGAPFAARLTAPDGTLRLTLTTDQPYLVVYSGGYLPTPGCALALEALGMPGGSAMLLSPGHTHRCYIRFAWNHP